MLDLKFVRENPDIVKQNIKNKFQDKKIPLVDEVIELDAKNRAAKKEADDLRANKNKIAKQIGALMGQGKKEEAEELKKQVAEQSARLSELEEQEKDLGERILKIMMTIPNIIDPSVPIGKDDSENVEIERFGEPVVPDFEIPYHTEIMEKFNGIDLDSARKVAGNGFYYLMGDIARLHSAVMQLTARKLVIIILQLCTNEKPCFKSSSVLQIILLLFTHTCPVTSFLHFETKQDRLPIIFNSTSSNRTDTPPGTVRPAPGHQVLLSFPHIFL